MSTNGHTAAAPPILLTVSGFDPSCGAGTVADLKTFAAHGCYGVAAITSMTVQNTQGVEAVNNTPSAELRGQLEILVKDCEIFLGHGAARRRRREIRGDRIDEARKRVHAERAGSGSLDGT